MIAATEGTDRKDAFRAIGTGELAGIIGFGGMKIDPDGTYRIWFDYQIGARTPARPVRKKAA